MNLRVNNDKVIDGVPIAVKSMRKGEIAWFRFTPKYHYYKTEEDIEKPALGKDGLPIAPKNEPIFYKIELVEIENHRKGLENHDFDGRIK